ncbi:hypothetical protein ACP4OV_005133 [Aristida adscensionis]
MADQLDSTAAAATSPAAKEDDDVDDLYADLDEQVAAALAAAGESGGSNARDSEPATTDGEGEVPDVEAAADANEAVDLGDGTAGYSSSDEESDDGLRILLNEGAGAPPPPLPPPAGGGEGCLAEDEDGEDSGSRVKGSSVNDGGWGKSGRFPCKAHIEKTTVPIVGQGDRGRQHMFQTDYNFFMPRNSTIFDINIEAFQHKPWRKHSVDLSDYFNFGLDEEGWRKYWFNMKQLRQGARSLANETSGLNQGSCKLEATKVMPKVANYSGFEGENALAKPKGRAIQVKGSACERLPSADMWRPIQRDSDVVIQVNMMFSPSNQSTSDDSASLNHKFVTTEKTSIDNPGDRCLKDSTFVADRVVDKEACDVYSSERDGSKQDRRHSYCARDRSFSPDYSDTFSEESKEDFYFKRAHRHSDSREFNDDSKLKAEHFYSHSSISDEVDTESDNRCYTPSADDRNQKATKLLWGDEAPFAGRDKSSDFSISHKSSRDLHKSRRKARKEQKRQSLDGGRRAVFDEQENSTENYLSRHKKYEQKISSSASLRNNYRHAVHNQLYHKEDCPPLERVSLRDNETYYSNESNHRRRRSSWHEISEGDDFMECFSSAKEWQQHRNYAYHPMLEAEVSNDNDGRTQRERYYEEARGVRYGHIFDDVHYTDYRFTKLQSPEVGRKYRKKGSRVKNIDAHSKHSDHHVLYRQANDNLQNSERDWPFTGSTFMSSRNRSFDNKRIQEAKMAQYHCDGYQKDKHRDSSFHIGNFQQSAFCIDAVAETGRCILPVKRKLHADLGSMNHKDLANLSLPEGRRLMMVSDRKIYDRKMHRSTKEIHTEAICSSNDMRNSNTISNSFVERRHELGNSDNIHLNDRKIKFKREGNELKRIVQSDIKGCLSVGKDLHSSKRKNVHQKQNAGYRHSGNQDLEKSKFQNSQNEEDAEIEEGELIEQCPQDTISKNKLKKPRKVVLKSVIETSSAEQLQVINEMPKDAACNNGAAREFDDRHILEIMEKMQKRRERFKESVAPLKEEDEDKKEQLAVACGTDDMQLAVACGTDDIQNQRPARKRRWGGNG